MAHIDFRGDYTGDLGGRRLYGQGNRHGQQASVFKKSNRPHIGLALDGRKKSGGLGLVLQFPGQKGMEAGRFI